MWRSGWELYQWQVLGIHSRFKYFLLCTVSHSIHRFFVVELQVNIGYSTRIWVCFHAADVSSNIIDCMKVFVASRAIYACMYNVFRFFKFIVYRVIKRWFRKPMSIIYWIFNIILNTLFIYKDGEKRILLINKYSM